MEYKTQTRRATKMNKCININLFISDKIDIGVTTSSSWGEYDSANTQDPLINIRIDDYHYNIQSSQMASVLKPILNALCTTTGKYRNKFLGENITETRKKIASGEYKLVDLNK